jgi:2-C-methyl-D-erythritol 4-phosphate cytidylyltransferase
MELVKTVSSDSSLGSAMLAGVAMGVFASPQEAVKACIKAESVTAPIAENTKQYETILKEYIAVHDGVRAMATKRLIIRAMLAAEDHGAVIPVVDVADSYRRVVGAESQIVNRSELRIVQTPQVFRAQLLRDAYNVTFSPTFTDDASVVEASGGHITLIEGERTNIKLTTPEDMAYAEWLLTANN